MEGLMYSLLLSSDPLISLISKHPSLYSRTQITVDNEIQNLLSEQNIQEDAVCCYNSNSD